MLTRKNVQDRLNFCKQYKDWSSERRSKVLFSDESTICQFGTFVRYVRRQEHDRYCVKNIIPTVKSQRAISGGGGHGPLHFVPQGKIVNSKKYLDVLELKLEKLKIWMEIHGCKVF